MRLPSPVVSSVPLMATWDWRSILYTKMEKAKGFNCAIQGGRIEMGVLRIPSQVSAEAQMKQN